MKNIFIYLLLFVIVCGLIIYLTYYANSTFQESFIVGIICNSIIFIVGVNWERIKPWFRGSSIRNFWSKSVFSKKFVIAYGALIDTRLKNIPPKEQFRFIKRLSDHSEMELTGPWEDILSSCEVRAASYVINVVSSFRSEPIPIFADNTAITDIQRTIVAFGSSSSNSVTKMVLEEPGNVFFEFCQTTDGKPYILDKRDKLKYQGFRKERVRDIGVILKLKNRYSEGDFFFICAGLGEWGTSGAAWYLSKKWNELIANGKEFGIILEVNPGSDTSAIPIDKKYGVEDVTKINEKDGGEDIHRPDEPIMKESPNIDTIKDEAPKDVDQSLMQARTESTSSINQFHILESGIQNLHNEPKTNYGTTANTNFDGTCATPQYKVKVIPVNSKNKESQ